MPHIEPDHVVAAWHQVEPLCLSKAERLADEVFKAQPNLLASVLVLPRFGVSHKDVETALALLFICFLAVRESKRFIREISEADQDRCFARLAGRAMFAEELPAALKDQAIADQIQSHPEPQLLAFAVGYLRDHDLLSVRNDAEKHLLLAVFNIVDTLALALSEAGPG